MRKISILALLLVASASVSAQLTGIDLFNEMNSPGFIQYDGQSSLPWLPGDMGYLSVDENEDGNIEFFKVNPANEKKSRLFNRRTKSAIINQYNELTDSDVSTYPFKDFDFVMDDEAIYFTVDGIDYVFE